MISFKGAVSIFLAVAEGVGAVQQLKLTPNDIYQIISKQIGGVNSVFPSRISSHNRQVQETDCPGTPFLWKIIENETGNHVGFGLGTMHLPAELVMTEESYESVLNAVKDSCDIYGEVNLLDPAVSLELNECMAPLLEKTATVSDIQDEDVKALYEDKLMEIARLVTEDASLADAVYQALLTLPIFLLQQFIVYSNTPEYMPYLIPSLTGQPVQALDEALLELGRIPGGVEEVSTQCAVLEELYVLPEELDSQALVLALNQSLSDQINGYKCGDVDAFSVAQEINMESEVGVDTEFEQQLLDDRNIQMASAVADILQSSDNKAFFAFGFLHWLHGDNSLEKLLNGYGYSLEHVPSYGSDDAEDLSDEVCGVKYNTTSKLWELDDGSNSMDIDTTGSPQTTPEATAAPDFTGNDSTAAAVDTTEGTLETTTLEEEDVGSLSISMSMYGSDGSDSAENVVLSNGDMEGSTSNTALADAVEDDTENSSNKLAPIFVTVMCVLFTSFL